MFNITPIVEAVVALILAIVTAVVIPFIKSKTTAQQRKDIGTWVKLAVEAAEQIYKGSGRGSEKKAYVLNWLADRNVAVDEYVVEVLIEAAVYEISTDFLAVAGEPVEVLSDGDNI